MKLSPTQLSLFALIVIPLTVGVVWNGFSSQDSQPELAGLQAENPGNHVELQAPEGWDSKTSLRSPKNEASLLDHSTPGGEPMEGAGESTAKGSGGFCVLIVGMDPQDMAAGSGQVRVRRVTPQQPEWSQEAMLVGSKAQFGNLPEGTFALEVLLEGVEGSVGTVFDWDTAAAALGKPLSFDMGKALAERNEKSTIATLRNIASAQRQMQASGAIDTDKDGGGEYGYFGELAGSRPMRIPDPAGSIMGGPENKLNPPFLARSLGVLEPGQNYGCVKRNGYYLRMHLPALSTGTGSATIGAFEAPLGGTGLASTDPQNSEVYWGLYAWPVESSSTPKATFFVNQEGVVMRRSPNPGSAPYVGLNGGPTFDAAHSSASPGDMAAPLANSAEDIHANDGGVWKPVSF